MASTTFTSKYSDNAIDDLASSSSISSYPLNISAIDNIPSYSTQGFPPAFTVNTLDVTASRPSGSPLVCTETSTPRFYKKKPNLVSVTPTTPRKKAAIENRNTTIMSPNTRQRKKYISDQVSR